MYVRALALADICYVRVLALAEQTPGMTVYVQAIALADIRGLCRGLSLDSAGPLEPRPGYHAAM